MTQLVAQRGPYSLTHTWYVDGTATDVGAVTIGVTDGNGDTTVAASTATTNNADGTYTYSLADLSTVDYLTATWTRSDTGADIVTRIEVAGDFLFTEAQARAHDSSALSNTTTFTDAMIADERARITDDLEQWTGRSWVPRYCRAEFAGTGTYDLWLADGSPRLSDGTRLFRPGRTADIATVLSVTVGGTAVSTANVVVDGPRLIRTDSTWTTPTRSNPKNVVVEWEYGLPAGVAGSDRIGMMLLRDRLVASAIPDRALSYSDELGTVRYVQPGGPMGNKTGLPEVNAWIREHDVRLPVG